MRLRSYLLVCNIASLPMHYPSEDTLYKLFFNQRGQIAVLRDFYRCLYFNNAFFVMKY